MKWQNKGNEYSDKEELYRDILGDGLYIFGTGGRCEDIGKVLRRYDLVAGYIDNDIEKQGRQLYGKEIISLDEYLSKNVSGKIVTALKKTNENDVIKQMKEAGLQFGDYYPDGYFFREIFIPMLFTLRDKIFVELSQISLTERCTLKCRKCAHGCFAVPRDQEDLPIETVKESADKFFGFVDYVKCFVLIGGEPLLYKNLSEALSYIGEKYNSKIERLQITTNGTIIPQEEVIDVCKKYKVHFVISNYTRALPALKERIKQLVQLLEKNKISYELFAEESFWMDYGFDHVDRKATPKELTRVFDTCRTDCHEIRGSRFYFCVMARSVSENMMDSRIGEEDYQDLQALDVSNVVDREIFVEYLMGYSDKGYLDMCNYCNGSESYKYVIPAAEQVSKQEDR